MAIDYDKISAILGTPAQLKVLIHMLNVRKAHLSGIAEGTGLAQSSARRVVSPLVEADILKENDDGRTRHFELNEKAPVVLEMKKCFEMISNRSGLKL